MDIKKLSKTAVVTYSTAYTLCAFIFGFDPNDEYRGNTKKLRKKLSQALLLETDYENPIVSELCELESDDEFIAFFKECYITALGYDEERTRIIEDICADYPENEKQAFKDLFTQNVFPDGIKYYDDKLEISLDDKNSYTEKLVLCGVKGFEKYNETEYQFSIADISRTLDGISVSCPINIYDDENATEKCVEFAFKSIKIELQIFAADELNFFDKPFDALCSAAEDVCYKVKLGDEYLNEKEKQLLPILYELASINNVDYDPLNFNDCEKKAYAKRFPLLKEMAAEYGLKKVVKRITVLENFANDSKKAFSKSLKLFEALNMIECEPLWRKIYNGFRESQSAYPKRSHNIEKQHYNEIVQEIEENLHACGYSGSYPDFYKKGALRGVRWRKATIYRILSKTRKMSSILYIARKTATKTNFLLIFFAALLFLKKAKGQRMFIRVALTQRANAFSKPFRIASCNPIMTITSTRRVPRFRKC